MLGVLTLGAAMLFRERQVNPSQRDGTVGQAEEKPRLSTEKKPGLVEAKEDKKTAVQEKMRLAHRQLDENMARSYNSITPELRAEIRQRHLEKARADYEGFFHTLNLSEHDIHQAVEVVLERETQYIDASENLHRIGFTKGGRDFAETRKVEQSVAEVQLRHLLGDEGYEQLTTFEKESQAQAMAKAMKTVSKYQND